MTVEQIATENDGNEHKRTKVELIWWQIFSGQSNVRTKLDVGYKYS